MEQQNPNPSPETRPQRPMTAEEIARAEAEAVAAILRGEAPKPPQPAPAGAPEPPEKPEKPDFVPYVDDVEPEPDRDAGGEDEAEEPYIPGAMEQRIDALTEKQWKLYQGIGGAVIGLGSMLALTLFNAELSMYGLAVAALLVLALPRYLERAWNHKMPFARKVMLISMIVGLAALFLISGLRTGFVFTKTE